ncbi:MAG TPA: hypothetical protein VE988_18740, partial [Gemmataceae bacterium]|nr:hypothetical protein [Gemmataceae bacterium]
SWPLGWFVICQTLLAAGVMLVSVWICLTFEDTARRLFVFFAVACLPAAAWVLTPHWRHLVSAWKSWVDERIPRITTLLLAVFAMAWLHCAIVDPSDVAPWLHRCVLVMAGVTWMCAIYGIALPRFLPAGNSWSAVARRLAGPLGCLACGFLALVMLQEAFLWDREAGKTPMALPAVVVVAAALAVLIGGAFMFALSPSRDVLKLSERGRTIYVYAAEILIVLLLVHLRYTVPEMFPKVGRFWPFVIVAVAFAGVGLSELSQRWGLRVLADPLQRTAMLLPLLPLAAFLIRPLKDMRDAASDAVSGATTWTRFIDGLPDDYRQHAAIWFLMGLLYLIVALTRRSSNLALVAAIIANFGIWVLLGHQGELAFRFHPQLWLIPIGVIVLFAESLNRERLLPSQAQAIRYAGILLIYISSTADMFIEGLGGEPWYPIALAVLSVAGVLVGILLRVRAFLFLGMTFLFLVVFSQIWHAAVDRAQTWVWWVSGIVLGVAILTMFALFEKRRNDVLKMIDEIKRWR